ncbi:S8 family peptidase [Patiriisocius hiemis]|uniref:S8/S53 family peptidase n=1 Tax=Patiriisocius hiemis TaxID=3075604 RepID=A0ABU2YEW2_9FLAO|nr:S8/S53 family peptidase [Constantimarinum sp. W242]MDT0556711.1 S8/S53 family peptidase [Constantimarinum sp. W242]
MKPILLYFLLLFSCCSIASAQFQDKSWMYLRAKDTLVSPKFEETNGVLRYVGDDTKLKKIFEEHIIYKFKKTYKNATRQNLKKTFFVISDKQSFLDDILREGSHLFVFGELIANEDKKIFEPNDYGLTSTIGDYGEHKLNLDYLDFLDLPKAWYYTTGSKDVIVGISDAQLDTINIDFKGKTKNLKNGYPSGGHGYGVSGIAAAQGNNGYGMPGVCYDCSIYGTKYGEFKDFKSLMELSKMGVRVINCSWSGSKYYETAQEAINEMYQNGTIIVASAGNKNWNTSKQGEIVYYPASYDKVISVSTVMYKNPTYKDAMDRDSKGNFFAQNVRNYVGRSLGFKDNDTLNEPHIWNVSVTTLNKDVDILAPSAGVFSYGKWLTKNKKEFIDIEATSPAAPFVTGTIGLMLSLNPCLPTNEIESILKMGSVNIDYIPANRKFYGNYGSGALNAGNTIELLYQLYTPTQTAYIQNQDFSRWGFNLRSFAKKTVFKNQTFREDATLELTSKNQVVLSENTILRPGNKGSIKIKIDSTLEKECELQLRDPSIEE